MSTAFTILEIWPISLLAVPDVEAVKGYAILPPAPEDDRVITGDFAYFLVADYRYEIGDCPLSGIAPDAPLIGRHSVKARSLQPLIFLQEAGQREPDTWHAAENRCDFCLVIKQLLLGEEVEPLENVVERARCDFLGGLVGEAERAGAALRGLESGARVFGSSVAKIAPVLFEPVIQLGDDLSGTDGARIIRDGDIRGDLYNAALVKSLEFLGDASNQVPDAGTIMRARGTMSLDHESSRTQ